MLMVNRKKFIVRIVELYFSSQSEFEKIDADLCILNQVVDHVDGATPFTTLHLDLLLPLDVLFGAIDKQVRYEIRRSENKDLLEINVDNSPDENAIISFEGAYNNFALSRGLPKCRTSHLLSITKKRGLVFSHAIDMNNGPLVSHAYVVDSIRARLLYSASNFKNSADSSERALYGRANRLLHWKDIEYFKANNYKIYDFGGIADVAMQPALAGINEFKLKFGGQRVTEYNMIKSKTILGKIAFLYQKYWAGK